MDEGRYKLPVGWRWVRLGEVCEIWDNLRKPVKKRDRPPGDVPYCGANGVIDYVDGHTHAGEFVLLAEDGGFYGPGEPSAYIMRGRFWANNHVHVLRAKPGYLRNDLLYWWLIACDLRPFLTGATRPKLTQRAMESIPVPVPPLGAQLRIVARIEEMMVRVREAKRLRQQARQNVDRLMEAVMAEVFPRPGTELADGWRWVRLGEVAWRESAVLKPSDQPNATFRYLGMEHVAPGQWDEPRPVEMRGYEIKSQVIAFRPGLVLYGKLRPYLNKVVTPSLQGVASTEFVPIASRADMLSPRYLGAFLRSPGFVAYATRNTIGSRQPRTRMEALWSAFIPLPPLHEQRRIVARLEAVHEKLKTLKEAQAATDAGLQRLEETILDKAFRGEL